MLTGIALIALVLIAVAALPGEAVPRDRPPDPGTEQEQLEGVQRILDVFVAEAAPDGGIDPAKSLWQAAGRGAAGPGMFPRDVDVRYMRFVVEDLYRVARLTGRQQYHDVADAQVRFVADCMREELPSWAFGNALEMIGVYHAYNEPDQQLAEAARRIVGYCRQRRVQVTTPEGVTFSHFPCGYGILNAKDAGWTNDLSMVGSGLVWAYEVTGDKSMLEDAVSFAEYFVQPWRPDAVGASGYWECGTWREDLGSWVVGPSHYTGFESTDAYGDEVSWVFSTMTCTDYLTRLYQHKADPRYLDRCLKAAQWTFRECQFADGAIGMCGRDDKWLGHTGNALSQVAMLQDLMGTEDLAPLRAPVQQASQYLDAKLPSAQVAQHGVEWVTRHTSLDPLVNVGMLWGSAVLGWLNSRRLVK